MRASIAREFLKMLKKIILIVEIIIAIYEVIFLLKEHDGNPKSKNHIRKLAKAL